LFAIRRAATATVGLLNVIMVFLDVDYQPTSLTSDVEKFTGRFTGPLLQNRANSREQSTLTQTVTH
jgi:hypothetical protein